MPPSLRLGRSSENWLCPHLHYEVRFKGIPQNPVHYYFFDLSPEQYDEIIQLAENAGHVICRFAGVAHGAYEIAAVHCLPRLHVDF